MTILITGSGGFIGYNLASHLKGKIVGILRDRRYYEAFKLSNTKINYVFGDLSDPNLLERVLSEYNIETIYHLGAQAIVKKATKTPVSTFQSNIIGTYNIFEAVRKTENNVKAILFSSTDKVYGESNILPYKETHRLNGKGIYDVSKICADMLAQAYFNNYGLPIIITRACNIFGEYDFGDRIIPNTIKNILQSKPPIIYKNSIDKREYIYVGDICDAYQELTKQISTSKGNIYNVGSGCVKNQEEIVFDLLNAINPKIVPKYVARKEKFIEISDQILDCDKLRYQLNWEPKTPFLKGLEKTIKWWRKLYEENTDIFALSA